MPKSAAILSGDERRVLRQLVSDRRRELTPVDDVRDRDALLDARLERRAARSTGRGRAAFSVRAEARRVARAALAADAVPPAPPEEEDDLGEDLDAAARREAFMQTKTPVLNEPERRQVAAALADAAERYSLTLREVEVIGLIAEGYNNDEIGVRLFIACETVKAHLRHILKKMAARNRAHAVALAAGLTLPGYLDRPIAQTEAAA
jgi:DNA-binding CsgD family transcriptional regulator